MSRRLTFHLIPHTHWDREWYLPRAAFQARLIPLLDDVLAQLDRAAESRFVLDGQTVLLDDYLTVRPEQSGAVSRAVTRGALETGPWYILADELMPSGESLVRNLLEGTRTAVALGRRLDVLYSPDAFGHPAMFPALARQFGLPAAALWRGVGRPGGTDRDLYTWVAPDNSEILLYLLPSEGYSVGAGLATCEGEDLARVWAAIRHEAVNRAATDQIAVFLGADHHAPAADLVLVAEQIRALEPDHTVRLSGLAEYCESVRHTIPPRLERVEGELRRIEGHAWVLQGVHGTRSRLKRLHAARELALTRLIEPMVALVEAGTGHDQRDLLRHTWQALLQSQFHDTLGGCSADAVALEQEVRLTGVGAATRELGERCWRGLSGHDADQARAAPDRCTPALFLWNPACRRRAGIITAELTFFRADVLVGPPSGRVAGRGSGMRPFQLEATDGTRIPVQLLGVQSGQERLDADRYYPDQDEVDRVFVAFQAPECDGLGSLRLVPRPSGRVPRPAGLDARGNLLRNRFVAIEVSETGIMTLLDRNTGERYPGLAVLEDEPDAGDSYTFARGRGRSAHGGSAVAQRVIATGPLVGALETRWTMAAGGAGDIECRLLVVLHADSPLVRLRYDLQNRASDHRLRARFAVGAGEEALAGAAFTSVLRPPVEPAAASDAIELPARTAPAHRFVAAAEEARGLALLAPGFFEYEWTADQDLAVTLLRSIGHLSRDTLRERPGHAGWPQPIPLAQEPGSHVISLALIPVDDQVLQQPTRLEQLWEEAFLPVQARFYRMYADSGRPAMAPTVRLEGGSLVVSALKPADHGPGLVARCYNPTGTSAAGRWIVSAALAGAWLLRADESDIEELTVEDDTSVRITAAAHAIVTVRLVFR